MRQLKRGRAIRTIATLTLLSGFVFSNASLTSRASHDPPFSCSRRYVAGGDGVVKGTHNNNPADDNYAHQLIKEHAEPAGQPEPWCLFNTAVDPATTDNYVTGTPPTQQSEAWNKDPMLITLTLGRQNNVIVDHIDKCFRNVKDHDFLDANACALVVFADANAWEKLNDDLAGILNTYKIQMNDNPGLVIAVTGYPNPYPEATKVATKIPGFCAQLQDTIPTCIVRWVFLPPALVTLDQVVKKMNQTIEDVVKQFTAATQGRFVFVNPYDKFKDDHCMEMKVKIKTKVYHPTNDVHQHDTDETNFGCGDTWIASDGVDGMKSPFPYLTPAVTGVLIFAEQTTKKMGFNPNEKGHDCISDLIWEAVKFKLDVGEEPSTDVCTG